MERPRNHLANHHPDPIRTPHVPLNLPTPHPQQPTPLSHMSNEDRTSRSSCAIARLFHFSLVGRELEPETETVFWGEGGFGSVFAGTEHKTGTIRIYRQTQCSGGTDRKYPTLRSTNIAPGPPCYELPKLRDKTTKT